VPTAVHPSTSGRTGGHLNRMKSAEPVGEVEPDEEGYRLCCVRGREGIIVILAEQIG
jgi:hypothetical protein